jgi:uncharacterized membrane protein
MPAMTARHHDGGLTDVNADPDVSTTVRLLHRRRGWAWTLGGSLIALVAFTAIGVHFWPNATGTVGAISGIIVILLLVLAVAALIMVLTDTAALRRRHPNARAVAGRQTLHHPLATHPFRTPVRHRGSHVFVWLFLILWVGLAIGFLPDQVNAVAYLAGAGRSVTFTAQSYTQECSRSGCHYVTNGTLMTNPLVAATWPDQVPLGNSFSVRQPIWNGWGTPDLMNGGEAVGAIFGALIFDIPTFLIIIGLVHMVRRKLRTRREPASVISLTS